MKIKKILKELLNIRFIIASFQAAFIFCFFLGIFWESVRIQVYDQNHRFYINRGLPTAWAGVSLVGKAVEFPIIKAPFLMSEVLQDRSRWNKIIDLSVFLPLLFLVMFISYVLIFLIDRIVGKHHKQRVVTILTYIILLWGSIFVYFYWFPRI